MEAKTERKTNDPSLPGKGSGHVEGGRPGAPPAGPGLTSSSRAAQGAGLRIVAGESRGLSFSPGHGDVSPLLGPLQPSEFALHLLRFPFILQEAGCFCAMCISLFVSPDDYEHPVTRDSQNSP